MRRGNLALIAHYYHAWRVMTRATFVCRCIMCVWRTGKRSQKFCCLPLSSCWQRAPPVLHDSLFWWAILAWFTLFWKSCNHPRSPWGFMNHPRSRVCGSTCDLFRYFWEVWSCFVRLLVGSLCGWGAFMRALGLCRPCRSPSSRLSDHVKDATQKENWHPSRVHQSWTGCPQQRRCWLCRWAALFCQPRDACRHQACHQGCGRHPACQHRQGADTVGADQREDRGCRAPYAGHQLPPGERHHHDAARHHRPYVTPGWGSGAEATRTRGP